MKENHLNWHHILDKQPEDGELIIKILPPYDGHYYIGMTQYRKPLCSWEELLKGYKDLGLGAPDDWWISAKDFPFPKEKYDA